MGAALAQVMCLHFYFATVQSAANSTGRPPARTVRFYHLLCDAFDSELTGRQRSEVLDTVSQRVSIVFLPDLSPVVNTSTDSSNGRRTDQFIRPL